MNTTDSPSGARKNVVVLAACQAFSMSGMSMIISVSALVGQMMADDKSLATVPLAMQFAGAMLGTIPASLLMGKVGRRVGFSVGQSIGACAAALAAYAIFQQDFWLFALASLFIGFHVATFQYFRFAAADAAGPTFKAKAISYVLAGGVISAVAGPQMAKWSVDAFAPVLFAGVYVVIVALCLVTILLIQLIRIPKPVASGGIKRAGRPIGMIMRQPVFIVAVMSAMLGYGTMTLVMTATPLAMSFCGFNFNDTATVIQFHILAMFVPSFFTGHLIKRFGVIKVILTGIMFNVAAMATNLGGIDFGHFSIGLICLGLGWNFMFIGGTTLMTEAYRPEEQSKTQAANDFLVQAATTIASFSSGALHDTFGWAAVNAGIALPMSLVFAGVVWFRFIHAPKQG